MPSLWGITEGHMTSRVVYISIQTMITEEE